MCMYQQSRMIRGSALWNLPMSTDLWRRNELRKFFQKRVPRMCPIAPMQSRHFAEFGLIALALGRSWSRCWGTCTSRSGIVSGSGAHESLCKGVTEFQLAVADGLS